MESTVSSVGKVLSSLLVVADIGCKLDAGAQRARCRTKSGLGVHGSIAFFIGSLRLISTPFSMPKK